MLARIAHSIFFKFLELAVTVAVLLLFRRPNDRKYVESDAYRLAGLQNFLRWGQQTASGDLTWPDPATCFRQNVRNECLEKVIKYELSILLRFAMTQEKPEGGGA